MGSGSPPKRRYDAPARREQAAATRRAILEAAHRRFVADGYVAAGVDAIAADAGVSRRTVYLAFDGKAAVLRGVWDLMLKGDVDDAPVAVRPWYVEMLEEPDPARVVDLVVVNSVTVKRRIGPILAVIRDAAVVDEDAGALWRLIQSDFHDNQRRIVEVLHTRGGLRPDLTVERATDVLWTLNHPDVWLLLAGQRGWTADAFAAWFGEALRALLLAPAHQPASPAHQSTSTTASSSSDAGPTEGRPRRPSSSSSGRRSTKPANIPPRSS